MKTHEFASRLQLFIIVILIAGIAGLGILFLSGVTFASSPLPTTTRLAPGQEQAKGMPQWMTGPSQISRNPTLSFAVDHVDILPGTMAEIPILITTNQNTVTNIAFTLKYAEYLVFEENIGDGKFLAGTTHEYTHDSENRAISFVISGTIQTPAVVVSIPLVAQEKDNVPEDVADQDVRLEQILLTTDSQVEPIAGPPKTVPYIIQTRLDVHVSGSNDDVLIAPKKIILGETSVLTTPLGWRGYDTIKWDIYGNDDPDGIFYTDEPVCEECFYRKTSTETEPFHPSAYVLDHEGGTILSGTLKTGVHVYVPPLAIVNGGTTFVGHTTRFTITVRKLYITDGVLELDFGDGSAVEHVTLPAYSNGKDQIISADHRYANVGEYECQVRLTSLTFGDDGPLAEATNRATVVYRPGSLQLEVDAQTLTANGKDETIVRAIVRNSNNQLMEGVSVEFSADPLRGKFTPAQTATTDENGVADVTFVSERITDWGDMPSIVVTIVATVDQTGAYLVETSEVTLMPFIELFLPNVIVHNRYAPD